MNDRQDRQWRRFHRNMVGLWILALGVGSVETNVAAQALSGTVRLSTMEDESIGVALDKPVYFPGDTIRLTLRREDKEASTTITPVVSIEGMRLRSTGRDSYVGILPLTVTPRSYNILLRIVDSVGHRFVYETGRTIEVEEIQEVESIATYVSIFPFDGGHDSRSAMTLERTQMQQLQLLFRRNSIQEGKGPQFVTVRTKVIQRDGSTASTSERRVMTFRSHGTAGRDHAMFMQYRTAYGAYAAISPAELDQVLLPLDSLPSWAIVSVNVTPDYTIKIGAYDPGNSLTRFYRVKGPLWEAGFMIGIPKVLYDSRPEDVIEYGNTSAMLRFYYVTPLTGNRFPISLGVGTFGVNSPIDVGVGKGGFALPIFLDLIELLHVLDVEFVRKVNVGVEWTPFFPIRKRARLLIDAQVSFPI